MATSLAKEGFTRVLPIPGLEEKADGLRVGSFQRFRLVCTKGRLQVTERHELTDMRMTAALLATMTLCGCVGSTSASPQESANVTSACELASDGAALDGRLVSFRSGFVVGVEHVRVVDPRCPSLMVFLRAADSKVDLTLCSQPNIRFGCPVNPDLEVKATFTGVFRASKRGGIVNVISMTEVSSDR